MGKWLFWLMMKIEKMNGCCAFLVNGYMHFAGCRAWQSKHEQYNMGKIKIKKIIKIKTWEPAFCSEYKAVIETDHLSGEPREKWESEFFIKYRKCFQYF